MKQSRDIIIILLFFFLEVGIETESQYKVKVGLELRLKLSESTCLSIPSAGIRGMKHQSSEFLSNASPGKHVDDLVIESMEWVKGQFLSSMYI